MIEPIRAGILAVEGAADNVEEEMLLMEREASGGHTDKENSMVRTSFSLDLVKCCFDLICCN